MDDDNDDEMNKVGGNGSDSDNDDDNESDIGSVSSDGGSINVANLIGGDDDEDDAEQEGGANDDDDEDADADEAGPKEAVDSDDDEDDVKNEVLDKVKGKGNDPAESDDEDEEEEEDDNYLQKFSAEVNRNFLLENHPECSINNYDEIIALAVVIRDKYNNIIDDLHKSLPYLTKYEKARVIGQRAKQINSGAKTFVKVPENVIDGYLIAELELKEKRMPFIIRRPIFGGGCEYWNIRDLENLGF